MITFNLKVSAYLADAFADLCSLKGTHLTITVNNRQLFISAVAPEFFKIYTNRDILNTVDFSIRIQKSTLKALIEPGCLLQFKIDSDISIRKLREDRVIVSASFPLEYDYNQELIITTINDGKTCKDDCDLSALISLRPMLPYSTSGLQFKNNLVYMHGNGFIVYYKLEHPCSFIMSSSNIAELVSLIRAYGRLGIYNSGIYTVFKREGIFLGCKQPVNFLDSSYQSYQSAKPLAEVNVDLCELCNVIRNVEIPKGDSLLCIFDFRKATVSISVKRSYNITVSIGDTTTEIDNVAIPLEVLKNILSNTKIKFESVHVAIYDSFIAFGVNGIDILLCRGD